MLPVLQYAQLPFYSAVKLYKHGVHSTFFPILVTICFPLLFPKTHIHTSQGIGESCPLRQESACLGASPSQGSTSLLPAFLSTKQNKNNVMSWQGTTLRVILLTLLYRCSHNIQAVLDAHAKAKIRGCEESCQKWGKGERALRARSARRKFSRLNSDRKSVLQNRPNSLLSNSLGNPLQISPWIHFFQIH